MDYIIDGYNFMFRLQGTKKQSLEKARETLVKKMNKELRIIKTSVIIVFDSSLQHKVYAQKALHAHLNVTYAPKGLSADEYIIELVEHAKNPKNLTIVTSDGFLTRQCQNLGAKTASVDDFMAFILKKNKPKKSSKPHFKEHPQEIERLRMLFEKRLEEES